MVSTAIQFVLLNKLFVWCKYRKKKYSFHIVNARLVICRAANVSFEPPRLFQLLQHLAELVQEDVHVALLEDKGRSEADADLATASGENT